ncbi:hypothetical protein LCGC14_1042950 [marine sediment metagenome]|uniref:Uncharacterized protein n=1 Tax=marine sediment metagenome TaxID=412755 RepID=A0A0F9NCW2_9ZZZZ
MMSSEELCQRCRHLRNLHGRAFHPCCKIWGCDCQKFVPPVEAPLQEEDLEPGDVEVTIEEASAFLDED